MQICEQNSRLSRKMEINNHLSNSFNSLKLINTSTDCTLAARAILRNYSSLFLFLCGIYLIQFCELFVFLRISSSVTWLWNFLAIYGKKVPQWNTVETFLPYKLIIFQIHATRISFAIYGWKDPQSFQWVRSHTDFDIFLVSRYD